MTVDMSFVFRGHKQNIFGTTVVRNCNHHIIKCSMLGGKTN